MTKSLVASVIFVLIYFSFSFTFSFPIIFLVLVSFSLTKITVVRADCRTITLDQYHGIPLPNTVTEQCHSILFIQSTF